MTSPRDHFDTHRLPQNATAAQVVQDEPSFHRVFEDFMKKAGHLVFHAPDIAFLPRTYPQRIENMIGREFGRLKVIGYFRRKKNPDKKAGGGSMQKWWCRCSCGLYCIRSSRTIKNPLPDSKCAWCEKKEYLLQQNIGR